MKKQKFIIHLKKQFKKYSNSLFLIYVAMSKTLSANYYQENKEKLQRKLLKDVKMFLRKKSKTIVVNDTISTRR